jgi:hypothetical protein
MRIDGTSFILGCAFTAFWCGNPVMACAFLAGLWISRFW